MEDGAEARAQQLQEQMATLLQPNGLGAQGTEERSVKQYPKRSLHVLLLCSGSVASVKVPLVVSALRKRKLCDVQVVASDQATAFFDAPELERMHEGKVKVWADQDEWTSWRRMGDPILHIELRRWADLVIVAPCSANTLAKIANGLCDNIVTSVLRALPSHVPVVLCPAMNTHMWTHALTAPQLAVAKDTLGYHVLGPIEKLLACGDMGIGAMAEWSDIVKYVVDKYELESSHDAGEDEAGAITS